MERVRLLLLDDHVLFREGLSRLLASEPDFEVAGQHSTYSEALDTLRDLARGIYPPLLADQGLKAALGAQARKATLPVDVDAEDLGRYPQDIEAAVYFCCLEALQNVQKYASATKATISVSVGVNGASELHFEVSDDGTGFDPATQKKGSGLQNMEDRLDALGGAVEVTSSPGSGTKLTGRLPVPTPSD